MKKEDQPKLPYKKKLIEVALPLEAINREAIREKYIPLGLPSNMHLWWARRPISASRAIIFSMLIDDPLENKSIHNPEKERKKIFKFIENLIKWENSNNSSVLMKAKEMISEYNDLKHVSFLDPFCGGGALPLEAQRLGINAYGSDLNPVAVMIAKALIELPYLVWDHKPIHPNWNKLLANDTKGLDGLIFDLTNYSKDLRDKAFCTLRENYPNYNDKKIVAWLWTRTIKCQNPACPSDIPLMNSFEISPNKVYAIPVIDKKNANWVGFDISKKRPAVISAKVGRGGNFKCPVCNQLTTDKQIREQKKIDYRLFAMVTSDRPREYLKADPNHESLAKKIVPRWKVTTKMSKETPTLVSGRGYNFEYWSDLFTNRQNALLTTYIDLLKEIYPTILKDSRNDKQYADILITYLSFAIERMTDKNSSFCTWDGKHATIRGVFARQAIPMMWDFAEANPFAESAGDIKLTTESIVNILKNLRPNAKGQIVQMDSSSAFPTEKNVIICTDSPYYDNVDFATLSDFFYVWLRESLKDVYPEIFSTILTPKKQETTAFSYRFDGDKEKAKDHFSQNIKKTFLLMKKYMDKKYPVAIFYAYKQSETENLSDSILKSSTGWETMIQSLIESGFQITGTWPIKTEMQTRNNARETNALASSIVIVCRPRSEDAPLSTRREFINNLKKELPSALRNLQDAGIAPVDMAQAAIGPGMAVFSRYSKVLEADGSQMSVRTALQIINQELDSYLSSQESEMDKETRFCIAWYEQFGWNDGQFGDANTLATAKGTAVNALENAGVIKAKAGKVRLLKRNELQEGWDPTKDKKLTVWECVQHLIKILEKKGETGAAEIVKKLGGQTEPVKELAYRLFALCEKKGWAEDARVYNELISSWQSISDKAEFATIISERTKKTIKDKSQQRLEL